jgi:tRNA(Ile)-lysidine synthase
MDYVVAVSGGVDSVVLLDKLYNLCKVEPCKLVVAHFDHGIRSDSHLDAKFVEDLANRYKLPFEMKREELGPNTSEETARHRRYDFLRSVAKKYNAKLVTAHHSDDVIETIAINLLRGTGWRGLAVMDSDIVRPLVDMTKSEIIEYAKQHKLSWREDSTNASSDYLRNRVRKQTNELDADVKRQLLALWTTQKSLKKQIDKEVEGLTGGGPVYERYFFVHLDDSVAIEILRGIFEGRLTRPQLLKVLHAIKTSHAGKTIQAGGGVVINFTSRNFTVELIK